VKRCTVCGTEKTTDAFYAGRGDCKVCVRAKRKAYVAANKDKVAAAHAAYRQTEHGRSVCNRNSLDRAKRPEGKADRQRWAATERGQQCRRDRVNKYAQTEKGRAANLRRRAARNARERELVNDLTADQWAEIIAAHENRCAYCGRPFSDDLPVTIDHVHPIARGGHHTAANVVPACKPCNSRKKDRIV
jgi:5-methylcytosine-specific restriction endonuclease McrA